jgi:hypothetical protein
MMYGTAWKKERTTDLVYQALKAGFRFSFLLFLETLKDTKHIFKANMFSLHKQNAQMPPNFTNHIDATGLHGLFLVVQRYRHCVPAQALQ